MEDPKRSERKMSDWRDLRERKEEYEVGVPKRTDKKMPNWREY